MLPMLDFFVLLLYKISKEGVDETKKLPFILSSRKGRKGVFSILCAVMTSTGKSTAKQKR